MSAAGLAVAVWVATLPPPLERIHHVIVLFTPNANGWDGQRVFKYYVVEGVVGLCWALMAALLVTPDDTSIVVRRDFDAPPDKVWQAMTEPEHLRRWLGDPNFPLTTCEMDVRTGGSYRWVFTQPDGPATMGVRGTYDEVERPHRIVCTEQFDDFPGPSINTLVLDERPDGRTAMTLTVRYADRETRDGWVASGMTDGLGRGYERLDETLDTIT